MSEKEFKKITKIGEGSFGTVYKVIRLANQHPYAMKVVKWVNMKEKEQKNSLNEIRLLASIKHPNIINYKQAFYDEQTNNLCLIMQLAENGDLANLIQKKLRQGEKFYEYEIWNIGGAVLQGLQTLHSNKIIHRDLKPANIFFDEENQVKLGDMNVSKLLVENLALTQTGTPYYASPQVWMNEPYSYQCDIWSFGCILYEMCTFQKPFREKNLEKLYRQIVKLNYTPIPYRFSEILSDTISKCLKFRNQRLTIAELQNIFTRYTVPKIQKALSPSSLLHTIKIPSNKKLLKNVLPKEKYEENEERYNPQFHVLDKFLKKNVEKHDSQKLLKMVRSEKLLKNISQTPKKETIRDARKGPSFRHVLNGDKELPLHEKSSIHRLNIRRRKLRIVF